MIGYVTIGHNDITKATTFYDAVMAPLDYERTFFDADSGWVGYGATDKDAGKPDILLTKPENGKEATLGNGSMLGLKAPSRAAVDAFHAAALANGGSCGGPPGVRGEGEPPFYGAYVRDPVGNKFCAYFKG